MRVGSLFSGGGLGDFGLELAGMEIAWQVEIDDYCQKLLNLRWPSVPKWKDVKQVKGGELPPVDLIAGGFPCQPFSVAGKRLGKDDSRNLWPEMLRVIWEVSPAWVIAENVPGIIGAYLDVILDDLEGEGYETLPIVFPAHALGAPHKRDRLWVVAHHKGERTQRRLCEQKQNSELRENVQDWRDSVVGHANKTGWREQCRAKPMEKEQFSSKCASQDVADSERKGRKRWRSHGDPDANGMETDDQARENSRSATPRCSENSWWSVEPDVGRVAHGVPNRVDRLKLLGNGQVVQVAYFVGSKVMAYAELLKET